MPNKAKKISKQKKRKDKKLQDKKLEARQKHRSKTPGTYSTNLKRSKKKKRFKGKTKTISTIKKLMTHQNNDARSQNPERISKKKRGRQKKKPKIHQNDNARLGNVLQELERIHKTTRHKKNRDSPKMMTQGPMSVLQVPERISKEKRKKLGKKPKTHQNNGARIQVILQEPRKNI
ncbi:1530_t:CDS:2 [Gigaspora margarita]|uniref:1530_t:CDS:1 n=1 Tax=Gigaspora margarita TaxID=4874 RepID=A0ABM8VXI9_GIGMA|nr:1530_t:CDS:2 [Gigaspora margarita]